jgi:hypothetical protein
LSKFAQTHDVTDSARFAGISRKTHYAWLENDPGYPERFRLAEAEFHDSVDALIQKHAMKKTATPTDRIFWAKRWNPEYRENYKVELGGPGGGKLNIEVSFVDPKPRDDDDD